MTDKRKYTIASVCAMISAIFAATSLFQIVMSEPALSIVWAANALAAWAGYDRAVDYREAMERAERRREREERDREYYRSGFEDIDVSPPRLASRATVSSSEGGARAARRIFP